ncbi:MAG: O-methyltransferase [Chloroflexia bacterium]
MWLDYTDRLDDEILDDAARCLRRLTVGSVLVVTVNAHPPRQESGSALEADVGQERVPLGIDDAGLAQWGVARAQYDVLCAETTDALSRRTDGAWFEQLFHIRYRDGARMLTWGGVLADAERWDAFKAARFDELAQVRAGVTALNVDVPALTLRETIHLNRQLPCPAGALEGEGIPPADAEAYGRLYRWYPPLLAALPR